VPGSQEDRAKAFKRSTHLCTEANQPEARRRSQLEARVAPHQAREVGCQPRLVAYVVPQPRAAVRPQHEPQLERPEAPPQRQLPVLRVSGRKAGLGSVVPSIVITAASLSYC
jgi:hypothetical protein